MASLKEVKGRIASVNGTRKITSAMKMVASAKLHKAQAAIENMLPYEKRLNAILTDFLRGIKDSVDSPYVEKREVKRVAIVVFSSNTSLCGGFNSNIVKHLVVVLDEYKYLGMENVLLYPVGRKVADAVKKMGFKAEGDFQTMADKPSYAEPPSDSQTAHGTGRYRQSCTEACTRTELPGGTTVPDTAEQIPRQGSPVPRFQESF